MGIETQWALLLLDNCASAGARSGCTKDNCMHLKVSQGVLYSSVRVQAQNIGTRDCDKQSACAWVLKDHLIKST